jgi:ABC-type Fe3+/spermidine/putrescine transport system ATPase subunit
VLVRPEHLAIRRADAATTEANSFVARVMSEVFVGPVTRYSLRLENGPLLLVEAPNADGERWRLDEVVRVEASPRNVVLIPVG